MLDRCGAVFPKRRKKSSKASLKKKESVCGSTHTHHKVMMDMEHRDGKGREHAKLTPSGSKEELPPFAEAMLCGILY